jgi:hypothetical protein
MQVPSHSIVVRGIQWRNKLTEKWFWHENPQPKSLIEMNFYVDRCVRKATISRNSATLINSESRPPNFLDGEKESLPYFSANKWCHPDLPIPQTFPTQCISHLPIPGRIDGVILQSANFRPGCNNTKWTPRIVESHSNRLDFQDQQW